MRYNTKLFPLRKHYVALIMTGQNQSGTPALIVRSPKFADFFKLSNYFIANYCGIPPNGEEGMRIFANKTGNRFGAVCPGSKISQGLINGTEPLDTGCGTIEVEYITNETLPGSALYRD